MPVPFIFGLIVGGATVVAYNKRKQISSLLKGDTKNISSIKGEISNVIAKGKETFTDIKDSIQATKETFIDKKEAIKQKRKETQEDQKEGN